MVEALNQRHFVENESKHVHPGDDATGAEDDGKHDAATDAADATDGVQDGHGRRWGRLSGRDAEFPAGRDGGDEEHDPGRYEASRGADEEYDPGTDETTDGIRDETGTKRAAI